MYRLNCQVLCYGAFQHTREVVIIVPEFDSLFIITDSKEDVICKGPKGVNNLYTNCKFITRIIMLHSEILSPPNFDAIKDLLPAIGGQ